MKTPPLMPLCGRFWRMLGVRWQRAPFDSGSHVTGGRWNAPGTPALYISRDYNTAIMEMHQDLVRPGTLVAYDVAARAIADLSDPETVEEHGLDPALLAAPWRRIFRIEGGTPPGWTVAATLIAAGAEGVLVPSVQNQGGVNLVLWRWHNARDAAGAGAALSLLDPGGDLHAPEGG